MVSKYVLFSVILCRLFLTVVTYYNTVIYVGPPAPPPPTELQEAIVYYDTNPDSIRQPIRDLSKIGKLIEAKKPKELKDFLSKASCENKINYRENIQYQDAVDLLKVKYSGLISLALVSMIGCPAAQVHAARLRIFFHRSDEYTSERIRDFTEVLVTVSETGEMHDAFLKFYEPKEIESTYESMRGLGLEADTENACFELIKRKRVDPSTTVNAKQVAEKLKNEMDDWDDDRGTLDATLMETPLEQLPAILDEFKSLNDQKSIEDVISEKFKDDVNKLTLYKQLVGLATSKIGYFADEINSRLLVESSLIEKSFPLANTIAMLAVLSKEDRKKVEEEYKKKFSIDLLAELQRMIPTLDFGEAVTGVLKMYVDELK